MIIITELLIEKYEDQQSQIIAINCFKIALQINKNQLIVL